MEALPTQFLRAAIVIASIALGTTQAAGQGKKPKAWNVAAGETHTESIQLAAAPSHKNLDPSGWSLHVSVECLEFKPGLELYASIADSDQKHALLLQTGQDAGEQRRAEVLLAMPPTLSEAGPVVVHLYAQGASLRAKGLSLHRFHSAPTKKLVGKANGRLGPDLLGCGFLGLTGLTEHKQAAFSLLDVREDGPAHAAGLRAGDLLVSVQGTPFAPSSIAPGWEWFEHSHEARLGRAIEAALLANETSITLTSLSRSGRKQHTLELPLQGDPSDGFPLAGALGTAMRTDILRWAVEHQRPNGSWKGANAVNPALGALGLLGTGDPQHLPAIKRTIEFLTERNPSPSKMKGLAYWTLAFQGILFCEYHLATGDESVLGWIREAIEWLPGTTHESKWGMQAFGHGPDGLPYGNKALMAPTAHLLVFDALARRCGVESKVWEHIKPYVLHSWSDPADGGHGSMGYNASFKDKGQFWSRSGLVALASSLRGDSKSMMRKLCLFMEERHPWMLNSHAYGEPGAALGLLSLAVASPEAFERILPQWRWRFLCAWEPGYGLRYSTPHMGAPYMGGESVINLAYLMLFATENDGLVIAGAKR